MNQKNSEKRKWKFFRAGGTFQPSIETGADIAAVGGLDMKLWAALSCPTRGLFFDQKTLDFIDADSDGRIRRDDIVAACRWACSALKNPDALAEGSDSLKLSDIDETSDIGARLLGCAREILENIGRTDADSVSVSDFDNKEKIFAGTPFNADGIITALSCGEDAELANALAAVVAACGAKADRSGLGGADAEAVEKFFALRDEFLKWEAAPQSDPSIFPLGGGTGRAYAAFSAISGKIDDYFARAAVAAFDPAAETAVGIRISQIEEIFASAQNGADSAEKLKALPLARISEGGLPLDGAANPAFSSELKDFAESCAAPVLGKPIAVLSRGDWGKIKSALAPYAAWEAARPNNAVAALGAQTLGEIPESAREKLLGLIAKDISTCEHADNVDDLEKLVRFNKNLAELLRNFVNFGAFYNGETEAIFQFGRLFIDSRDCGLCIKVEDVASHSALAASSYGYLLYCACRRKGEPDMCIVAVVTAGDSDNLVIGRNGVFYDRFGRDWDATVVKIVQNPVGLGQAFWSPYKRMVKWASEQIAKRASAADAKAIGGLEAAAQAPKTEVKKIDIGTVAALGVAVGGITTAFGMVLDAFFSLGYWIPLGIIGLILAISVPSMIVAGLKLRMRSLAPILDANGWAINCKASVSALFGGRLTRLANAALAAGVKPKFGKVKIFFAAAAVAAICLLAAWCCGALERPFGMPAPHWSPFGQKAEAAPAAQPAPVQADNAPVK